MRLILSEEQVRQVAFVAGDVTDLPALKATIDANGITHVVHLAGLQVPTCRANPVLGAKVNVLGTLAVLEAVREARDQVERLVYASSAAVFGPPDDYPPGPLADDVKLTPTTHYGFFKCCNEGNARVYFQDHGLSSVGLRPWTVYGVGRDFGMTSEPTRAVKALAVGRPYHIGYGGMQDLQYVEDVAGAFVRCLEAPYTGAKSYNLRGDVVGMPEFHRALCTADPRAAEPRHLRRTATRHRLRPRRLGPPARPRADAAYAAGSWRAADAGTVPSPAGRGAAGPGGVGELGTLASWRAGGASPLIPHPIGDNGNTRGLTPPARRSIWEPKNPVGSNRPRGILPGSPSDGGKAVWSILGQGPRLCDGLTRREWLRVGGLSAIGLSLPALLGRGRRARLPAGPSRVSSSSTSAARRSMRRGIPNPTRRRKFAANSSRRRLPCPASRSAS